MTKSDALDRAFPQKKINIRNIFFMSSLKSTSSGKKAEPLMIVFKSHPQLEQHSTSLSIVWWCRQLYSHHWNANKQYGLSLITGFHSITCHYVWLNNPQNKREQQTTAAILYYIQSIYGFVIKIFSAAAWRTGWSIFYDGALLRSPFFKGNPEDLHRIRACSQPTV